MSIAKYRSDVKDAPCANGSIMWRTKWMGGRTPAKVENCPIDGDMTPRMVYVQGDADSFFSIPAACSYKGKRVNGWLEFNSDDDGGWLFHPNKD